VKENKFSALILAAGKGTRMKSDLAKVLHVLNGKPLLHYSLAAAESAGAEKIVVIIGHQADKIRDDFSGRSYIFVEQKPQLGTGHAVLQAKDVLARYQGKTVILCGDVPLLKPATIKSLIENHIATGAAITVLTTVPPDAKGYGRIIKDVDGNIAKIVEERDATTAEKQTGEINTGIYCADTPFLFEALGKVTNNNDQKEYYLTDAIEILRAGGERVDAQMLASIDEIMGINDRAGLADAEKLARKKILHGLMLNGVTVENPETTTVGADVKMGADTVIRSGCVITGKCSIGANCDIGPYAVMNDAIIGEACKVGPFAHLRPGTVLKTGAKVGNFCEVKKSVVGIGSKVNHLSYIGDATLGNNVNVGAGTITCNYDGKNKFKTVIGDRVFIGSNTNLVAPVTVGAGALIAAGSTITDNVPKDTLAIARQRQVNKKRKKKNS